MTDGSERWLIAGCGQLGSRVARGVLAAGGEVDALRRDPSGLPPGVHGHAADLARGDGLDALPSRPDVVLICAAVGRGADAAAYRALYVDGTRRLLDALRAAGAAPRRLLFTSSTAVYAQVDGSEVDEDSPTEPTDFRGTTMLAAERCLAESGWPATSLRLGGIYGPGRTWLVDAVRGGRVGLSADGRSPWTNRIHVHDAAEAVRHVAALPHPADRYVVVDRCPARRDEVVEWLAARLGVVPARETVGSGSRGGDRACRSERLGATGFAWRYPSFRDGYAELLGGG